MNTLTKFCYVILHIVGAMAFITITCVSCEPVNAQTYSMEYSTDAEEHYQSQGIDMQAEVERANREWREQHGDTPPNITDAQQAEAERFVAQLQQQFNKE